ncbi:MAG TPA: aminotransferase class I/II-fold pyridoxal phosphate-dependent enzyme [Verrucomicrobiales bacterium]|nr:aminotransferase class I/II-fold pyridoxal phosphate-dependent enzyme [Verrucomicrobiales bacterium]
MNFADFQKFRDGLLKERQDIIDCAETNLYRTLARLTPPPAAPAQGTVHRCHLASEWVERFGFAPETSRRALISCGVRDSLARIFRHFAGEGAALWIPADNYPVYGELARAAGLTFREFVTLPAPVWPDAPPVAGPELLLLTNPLKPCGRYLTPEEIDALKRWLAARDSRRLLVDAVYTFDTAFHSGTLDLLESGQTILLHSLTKGWLHPRLFGIALVPAADAALLTPAFRADPPSQENLARARDLMGPHASMPAAVARELESGMLRLREKLPVSLPAAPLRNAPGYFLTIERNWKELLEIHRILGLPASVFGSSREDVTILSSLTFCL